MKYLGVPQRNFSAQKIFERKSWYSPPLLSINFFATGNFLKHSTEGFPYKIFRHCETKNFRKLLTLPPLIHKIFRYPKLSKNRKVPLRIFSVLWDKKFSVENRDIPLLGIKFFDTRNFLKHTKVPLRNDSVLWDKTILTENRDTRPLSYSKHFSIPEISETQKGSWAKFFGTVRRKFFNGKSWYPFA